MESVVQKPSFLDTMKTVFAGAIGIRRKDDHERAPVNPLHLVIVKIVLS
jgi:hypothetical protein